MKSFAAFISASILLILILYANIAIRIPLVNGVTDHAFNGDADSCHNIIVDVPSETPSCGSTIAPQGVSSYANTVTIHVQHDITTRLTLHWNSFWCPDGGGDCTQNKHDTPFSYPNGLKAGTYTFSVNRTSDNGLACGSVQNDFWFTYNNGTCRTHFNGGFGYGAWGFCQFWNNLDESKPGWHPIISCANQPTPTPTMTPVPTPTPTTTPTPLPTATPTIAPTATPTEQPTPTQPIVPTLTPTPTQTTTSLCNNEQNNNGGSTNNNCNVNTNSQTQSQSQNNSQTVNISVAPSQQQSTPQVMSASTASQLPSTGTPIVNLVFLVGLIPAGVILRKWPL